MTEAFEKWAKQYLISKHSLPEEERDVFPIINDAHFWICAFAKEVVKRANEDQMRFYDKPITAAFIQIVREFGLDGDK